MAMLVVAALYTRVGGVVVLAAAMAGLAVTSIVLGARLHAGVVIQRVATVAAGALGGFLGWTLFPTATVHVVRNTIDPIWSAAAMVGMFAASVRLFFRAPEGGVFATMGCALLALVACGETRQRDLYAPACVAFVVCTALAMRAGDAGRLVEKIRTRRRDLIVTVAIFTVAGMLAAVNAITLPALADRADRLAGLDDLARTGFTDQLGLGSIDRMLVSDEVVMRIVGGRADYLRGAVYDTYGSSQWRGAEGGTLRALQLPSGRPSQRDALQLIVAGGDVHRYFLPLGASHVATGDGSVQIDRYGVAHVAGTARVAWFTVARSSDFPVLPPTPRDRAIPSELNATLARLVAEWTEASMSPRRRALAIERHLRTEYRYSLHFHRRGHNPLEEFLVEDRQGHCEYFASALALLLRAASIPARVAVGYRVHEQSPIDGHSIVRERDAHAWVEAFFDDNGWQTLDATPPAGGAAARGQRVGLLRAVGEWIATWIARWRAANTMPVWIALGLLVVGLILYREVRSRLAARRNAKRAVNDGFANEPAPAQLDRLLAALAARGVSRSRSETIEAFARRVKRREGGFGDVSASLLAYAALRYGGEGDRDAVLREMERAERELPAA
jgi:hypothetical protein